MADKDKQAYWKGVNDSKKPSKGVLNTLVEGSNYQPPSGRGEAYKAGYEHGKSEKK